ncbi:MAG: metal-dependent transcriptional regulator [Phycisphaeraceae bacterium]|nr:metal-dependent transcriptional regulator [Phycisphaeraceae bacterium]
MPTSTVENYLKTIYMQQQRAGGKNVAMGKLAKAMDVVPGTATAMIKTLADSGLVDYKPRGGVSLSDKGETLALHILRRHRLLELFLVEVLGLDWTEVHDEAEELEHATSDKVLARIDDYLGHPDTDPHGDPIPPAKGAHAPVQLKSLADSATQKKLVIARVVDQGCEFLQFLNQHGLRPGTRINILSYDRVVDAITVKPYKHEPVTLGMAAAGKILVEKPAT